jgi:hypothetical protein
MVTFDGGVVAQTRSAASSNSSRTSCDRSVVERAFTVL